MRSHLCKSPTGLNRKLFRVGLYRVYGCVSEVSALGIDLRKANVISTDTVKTFLNPDGQVVDLWGHPNTTATTP